MHQVNRKGKSFFNISSFSSALSVVNLRLELKLSLKLRYAIATGKPRFQDVQLIS